MNKIFKICFLLGLLSVCTMTHATSDDECGIWLCAPIGFNDGSCSGPHRAMIKRIHTGRSPLPPLSSCGNNNSSNNEVVAHDGRAAYIPSHTICTEYKEEIRYGYYGPQTVKTCVAYGPSGDSWVKDSYCIHGANGHTDPKGCTTTDYYVEVLNNDGSIIGSTYFFNID